MPKTAQPAPLQRKWLEEAQQRSGMSWREFADAAETPYTTMMDYRSGDRTPRMSKAKRMGKLVGFDWRLFYEGLSDETAS